MSVSKHIDVDMPDFGPHHTVHIELTCSREKVTGKQNVSSQAAEYYGNSDHDNHEQCSQVCMVHLQAVTSNIPCRMS